VSIYTIKIMVLTRY